MTLVLTGITIASDGFLHTTGPGAGTNRLSPGLLFGTDGGGIDSNGAGALQVNLATRIAGEDLIIGVLQVEQRFAYAHLNSLATTTIKNGAGFLHTLVINTKGVTGNTITLYDNTAGSGTVIAVIDTTAERPPALYDVSFSVGLTAVMATGTAADITVSYR